MKGPFFQQNRIGYEILWDSCFDDVDIAVDKIKLKYDVNIKEKIEVFDSYWIVSDINQKYTICVRYHDPVGLRIYAENEESNIIVTEIAEYLDKEFNGLKKKQ
ncbi:MAG: hypothetical protein KBC27_00180 [Rickettsiales bacterium]|nr:hypothetical protein [Rickettsiales bacterium]